MNAIGIGCDGGVRVGLEDDIWYDRQRTKLARNIDLLKRVHRIAQAADTEIMAPAELRSMLNLEPGRGRYGRKYRIPADGF